MKEGRVVGGRNGGRLHTSERSCKERKGNVQALGLWDTLPTCLGWQNECRLLNHFVQDSLKILSSRTRIYRTSKALWSSAY